MNKNIIKTVLLVLGFVTASNSCSSDFVEREFRQDVIQTNLTSVAEIQSFVRGCYASMRSSTYYGRDFLCYGEVRSDEMYSTTGAGYFTTVQNYSMLSSDAYASGTYNQIYTMIAKANIVINTNLTTLSGTSVDKATAAYFQGQAYALRAQGFFDLLRLYGQKYTGASTALGVVTPTQYDPKAKKARSSIADTEAQIEADFAAALTLMNANAAYDTPSNKTELSINALKALMSRYYLYKGDYAKVRTYVGEIVASAKYSVALKDLYQETFRYTLRGAAPNSIFELAVGTTGSLSTSSLRQIMNPSGYANVVVKPAAYALYAANDVRRSLIALSSSVYYLSSGTTTGKYTNSTGADNIKMIRYEEVLLNGVEAELNGGDAAKALTYYKLILANRLADTSTETVAQQLAAITSVDMAALKTERLKELIGEGFRQWDQLRWGDSSFKPSTKSADLLAFPIPRAETDLAGTLVVANPGYDN